MYAIFGNSYSGSTLLNALLGSHPDIAGGGELHWLTSDPKEAMCSICGEGCPIWTSERRQHASLVNLYDLTAEAFDRPLVADASKMPDWFNKILPLCEEAHLPIRRILLVKHPVRHVASYLEKARRFNHLRQYRSVEAVLTALQNWYLYAFRSNRFDRIIKYEELATAPQAVVADALGLFGLDYRPQIDDWQSQPHHHVGGNAGPRTQIARHLLPAGEFLREKYRRDGVFLDDSYHDVLSTEEIEGIQCSPAARFIREIFGYSLDPSQPMSTLGT